MMRSARLYVRTLCVATTMIAAGAALVVAQEGNARADFELGNASYEEGDYAGAIAAYHRVLEAGVADVDLYYNLGNAYYQVGELGRAVLFYERSLELSPRLLDARQNLSLVHSLLHDKQFLESPGRVRRFVTAFHNSLNTPETFYLASLLYLLFTLACLAYLFRDSMVVDAVYRRVSVLSPGRLFGLDRRQDLIMTVLTTVVLLTASGASALSKYHADNERRSAIVIPEEVSVFGGPTRDSTLQYKIHEGTKLTIVGVRPGWLQIRLPGDLSGWIDSATVERI